MALTFDETLIVNAVSAATSMLTLFIVMKFFLPRIMQIFREGTLKSFGLEDRPNNCHCDKCQIERSKKKKFKFTKWSKERDK